MTTDRIKEIQAETGSPDSISVQQALLKVWNECSQKQKSVDYLETVAEEITLMMGLKTKVVNEVIEVDTIAGKMKFKVVFGELMQDVYRFIYFYGTKLHKYGIEQRINCG